MSVVELEKSEGIAWVTLNRPEAMNALSGEVLTRLLSLAQELGDDPDTRAVVITGAGPKAFCAGADLKERKGMSARETQRRIDLIGDAFDALAAMPRPTIAAINGFAFGGGLELALACDFRIAAAEAKLGLTEVRLGIMPGAGGTQRLPRIVGTARAKELIMLGKRISAEEAAQMGLVNRVVASDELRKAAQEMVGEMAGCAPISVAQAKAAIDRGMDVVIDEGLRIERACYEVTLRTEDRNEGLRAFAEKRQPNYQGK